MFIFLFISRWSHPSQINGVLEFYLIFLSHDNAERVLAYNSSEVFEDYTLRNLTPGTLYTITVAVSPLRLNFDFQFVRLYHIHSYVIVYVCACVCVCMAGLYRRWMYFKSTKPGSDWREHPWKCPCTTGHSFVPQYAQCHLDSYWHSEWWEGTHLHKNTKPWIFLK